MHLALRIPELVSSFLAYIPIDDHPLIVNRQWTFISLRIRWTATNDFRQLLHILQPSHSARDIYRGTPSPERWAVFTEYASLVRVLSIQPEPVDMAILYAHRPVSHSFHPICPHLQELNWFAAAEIHSCQEFMHRTIHTLRIQLPTAYSVFNCSQLFHSIIGKMCQLRTLDITMPERIGTRDSSFAALIKELPFLESFGIENASLGSELIAQLALSPKLEELKSAYSYSETTDQSFPVRLCSEPFPFLTSLSLTIKIQTFIQLLSTSFQPFGLNHLRYLSSPLLHVSSSDVPFLPRFFQQLVSHCPLMERLHLDLLTHERDYVDPPSPEHVINFDTLQPLTQYAGLTEFSITHDYQLSLLHGDVERLLANWPLMEFLSLNPHPPHFVPPSLTLETVLVIGTFCPRIRHIGILLDARGTATREVSPLWLLRPMPSLLSLNMGVSNLSGRGWYISTGAFFAHVCPNITSIDSHVPWADDLSIRRANARHQLITLEDSNFIAEAELEVNKRTARWALASSHMVKLLGKR